MERAVLAVITVAVAGVVVGVHWDQTRERREMHKGVLRDIERQQAKQQSKQQQADELSQQKA
jgi:hypothetical protein